MFRTRATWHHDFANITGSASSLVFLIAGVQLRDSRASLVCLGLAAVVSFVAWVANLRRFRLVSDTPTSRIASASQGYTELFGRAAAFPNAPLLGKRSGYPCVWYRCITEREANDNWEIVADEISDDTFLLVDHSGKCVIAPDYAEVFTQHKRQWSDNGYRLTEWSLRPGDQLYAIGELVTEGGASADLNLRDDVGALLIEWKKNQATLLARFDTDKNGEIDLNEWEVARKAARVEIEKHHHEIRLQDGVHILRKPADRRLFLLSNLSPRELSRRYAIWAWLHLGFLFAAIVAMVYLWSQAY